MTWISGLRFISGALLPNYWLALARNQEGRGERETYLLTILQEFLKIPVVLQSHQKLTGCLSILPMSVIMIIRTLKKIIRESGNTDFTTRSLPRVPLCAENSLLTVLNSAKKTR